MREAFGGMFMLRLLLVFIFIYIVFAAISYNYAQAFKLKNSIISYIEEKDIINFDEMLNSADESLLSDFDEILSSYTYRITCADTEGKIDGKDDDDLDPVKFCHHGIVVEAEEKDNIITYKVNTFVYMNLPLINRFYMYAANNNSKYIKEGTIQINGEAKVVKRKEITEENDESGDNGELNSESTPSAGGITPPGGGSTPSSGDSTPSSGGSTLPSGDSTPPKSLVKKNNIKKNVGTTIYPFISEEKITELKEECKKNNQEYSIAYVVATDEIAISYNIAMQSLQKNPVYNIILECKE